MSDSNTHIHNTGAAEAAAPVQVVPSPTHGKASAEPQPKGSPAPGRKPLFGS
jgi:hypothetical protein